MAQLVRAPPCHGGGRRFESDLGRRFNRIENYFAWGLSSAGRASALQAEGHRFEPCRPHSYYGWVPEWPKGADCKSVSDAFGGSNPPPSISLDGATENACIFGEEELRRSLCETRTSSGRTNAESSTTTRGRAAGSSSGS